MRSPFARQIRPLAIAAMAFALAACEGAGFSGRDAELARQRAGDFYVSSASRDGAMLVARGQKVAVEPAPGFCLAEDSIETSSRSAFVLIGDCAVDAPDTGQRSERGEMPRPRSIPGIMTVSISGDAGLGGGAPLAKVRAFLETAGGKAMLGRAGSSAPVTIRESREIDGVLFVHLEDSGNAPVPVFQSHFWRAFVDLNGRMTVATISGFRDKPMESEEMLAYLVSQVQTLQAANVGLPRSSTTMVARAEPTRPAPAPIVVVAPKAETPLPTTTAPDIAADSAPAIPEIEVRTAALSPTSGATRIPVERPAGVTLAPSTPVVPAGTPVESQIPVPERRGEGTPEPATGTSLAPVTAPNAPRRPRR